MAQERRPPRLVLLGPLADPSDLPEALGVHRASPGIPSSFTAFVARCPALTVDVYIWLACRLHSLAKTTPVSWLAVHRQFGAGFRFVRQIKPTFLEALTLALAVYPEAHVDADKNGITLHPSPPAVPHVAPVCTGMGLY